MLLIMAFYYHQLVSQGTVQIILNFDHDDFLKNVMPNCQHVESEFIGKETGLKKNICDADVQ